MLIFRHLEYRAAIKEIIKFRKNRDSKYNYSKLAAALRIQGPYLSKVLGGQAHFNSDQLYLVCDYLELADEEVSYLFLLLEYERSGLGKRRRELFEQITQAQAKQLATESNILTENVEVDSDALTKYYLNPIYLVIHMAMSIPEFQIKPEQLLKHLNISAAKLKTLLIELESMKMLKYEDEKYLSVKKNLHLPSSSQLYKAHKSLLRQFINSYLQYNESSEDYNLSITFSADNSTKKDIHRLFLEFLKEVDKLIKAAPCKDVLQMNFDLFAWCETK